MQEFAQEEFGRASGGGFIPGKATLAADEFIAKNLTVGLRLEAKSSGRLAVADLNQNPAAGMIESLH